MPRPLMLVVEDHEPTRRALRGLLRCKGWDVVEAGTVQEGLAQLDPAPACVILDLMLPDGGGEEILRRIREDRLPSKVAVCSGTFDPERLEAVRALEPDLLLQKPYNLDAVTAIGPTQPERIRFERPTRWLAMAGTA